MTIKKKLVVEIEMSCSTVSDSIIESGIDDILNRIKNVSEGIVYDGYSNILHDYLQSDPYKEHVADLLISVKQVD